MRQKQPGVRSGDLWLTLGWGTSEPSKGDGFVCWVSSLKLLIKFTNPSRSIPVPAWLINTSVLSPPVSLKGLFKYAPAPQTWIMRGQEDAFVCSECACSWAAPSLPPAGAARRFLWSFPAPRFLGCILTPCCAHCWDWGKPSSEDNKSVGPEETPDCLSPEQNPIIQQMNFPILSQNSACGMWLCWMAVGIGLC